MTLKEWIRKKVLSFLGMNKYESTPGDDKLTFINDRDFIMKQKIREYNVWYLGDSDELLNYYTRNNTINYNYEPFYQRNKMCYFWSVASTENDIKRTHSGLARAIIDILVAIIEQPEIKGQLGPGDTSTDALIQAIIEDNDFWKLYTQVQLPMTLVEGWGCWKINWNTDLSKYPIIEYVKAEGVEFIKRSNRLIGVIFKETYEDKNGKHFMITETRRKEHGNLYIEKELFELSGEDDVLQPREFKDVPELAHIEKGFKIENFDKLLCVPCVFYEDTDGVMQGRSLYAGLIDLFDDLDQCLSQSSNAVRRSTPIEYFNTDFLERDEKTGMPIQPKSFDRKYSGYSTGKDANGAPTGTDLPVYTSQPKIDFGQYDAQAQSITFQILNGKLSPATLGIEVSRKDNAAAQREKEKVTIATRNMLTRIERKILAELFTQALCAYELMSTGMCTIMDYNVSVKYNEFADASFESKVQSVVPAYKDMVISTEMFLAKLYGDSLTPAEYAREKEFLDKMQQMQTGMGPGGPAPGPEGMSPEMMGEEPGPGRPEGSREGNGAVEQEIARQVDEQHG